MTSASAPTTTSTSPSSSADRGAVGPARLRPVLTSIDLGCARVWCTDRRGGVSRAPYDSLNLAVHVGDDPLAGYLNAHRIVNLAVETGCCSTCPATLFPGLRGRAW